MPKERFDAIYQDLKLKIEASTYSFSELLPSENVLKELYGCSRNTIRRAETQLAKEGYIQAIQGKGVQVIFQASDKAEFVIGGIESFPEMSARNKKTPRTEVACFMELIADEATSARTGFPVGSLLYYIERIRYLDEIPLIFDINMFLKSEVGILSREIAAASIYQHLEETCKMQITTSKRRITAEKANPNDMLYLQLEKYGLDFVSVITGQVYNSNGVMFEYTQSRHHPDYFCFFDTAVRTRH